MKTIYPASFLRLFFILFLTLSFSTAAFSSEFKRFLFFGDSLSDMGNNTWILPEGRDPKKPDSASAPVTNHYNPATGKPAGATWTYFLSQNLMGKAPVNAFSSTKDSIAINFAWAAAETGDNYIDDITEKKPHPYMSKCSKPGIAPDKSYSCTPGLIKQIRLYLAQSSAQNGRNPVSEKDTLVFLFAGSNDIMNNLFRILPHKNKARNTSLLTLDTSLLNDMNVKEHATYLLGHPAFSHPVDNMVSAVKLLVSKGFLASNIVVFTLPDFSRIPGAKKLTSSHLTKLLEYFCEGYNYLLKRDLGKAGFKDIHILDAFQFLKTLTDKPKAYGFTVGKESPCTDHPEQLETCKGFVFFNDLHPTTATYQLFTKSIEQCLVQWYPGKFPHKTSISPPAITLCKP